MSYAVDSSHHCEARQMPFPSHTTASAQPDHPPNTRSAPHPPRIPLFTTRHHAHTPSTMTTLVPNPLPSGYPVWAFICGYPWWPAKVVHLPSDATPRIHKPNTKAHDNILVEFFHDNKHTSFVPLCCLRYFPDYHVTDLNPDKIPAKLQRAVNEATHYVHTVWAFRPPVSTHTKPLNETGFRPVKRYRPADPSVRRPFSISPSRAHRPSHPAATSALRQVKKETHTSHKLHHDSQGNTTSHPQPQPAPTIAMLRLRDAEIVKLRRLVFDMRATLPDTALAQLPQLESSFGPVCRTAADLLGRCSDVFAAVSKFLKRAEQSQSSPHNIRKQEDGVISLCRGLLALHVEPSVLADYGLMYVLKARELAEKSKVVSPEIHFTLCAVADSWDDTGGVNSGLSCDFDTSFN
eukprot:GFKZ01012779.1.p1 GENE.GFKZ01012779.1~~GFKZ01012779.1.p1  ORF type:complete len:406 (+),score=43.03 GFKZ01012779.1:104-1321(+)